MTDATTTESPLQYRARRFAEISAKEALDPAAGQMDEADCREALPGTVNRWMREGRLVSLGLPAPRARR